jgi:hypothetical protein
MPRNGGILSQTFSRALVSILLLFLPITPTEVPTIPVCPFSKGGSPVVPVKLAICIDLQFNAVYDEEKSYTCVFKYNPKLDICGGTWMGKDQAEARTIEQCAINQFCFFCCIESKCMIWDNCERWAGNREKTARTYLLIISLVLFMTIAICIFYRVIVQTSHNRFLQIIDSKEIEKSLARSNYYNANSKDFSSNSDDKPKLQRWGSHEDLIKPNHEIPTHKNLFDDDAPMQHNLGFHFGTSGKEAINNYQMLDNIVDLKLRKTSSHAPEKSSKSTRGR